MSAASLPFDLLRLGAIGGVNGYRRWISPRKGYACPHRLHHGQSSCSQHGLRLLRRLRGRRVFLWWPLMQRRFAACRASAVYLAEFNANKNEYRKDDGKRRWWHWSDFCCITAGCDLSDCTPCDG